jgi:deoxyhypusine synthase
LCKSGLVAASTESEMSERKPISLEGVTSYPLKKRRSKVSVDAFGQPWIAGESMDRWLASLPRILAASDLMEIRERIIRAVASRKPVILGMGAHAIKVGLNPIIIDLLERRVITGLAMNGACIIHDAEVAMVGKTSEDVAAEIGSGAFGMADETGRILNKAIIEGAEKGLGLGESVGAMLIQEGFPYNRLSLLAMAYTLDVPVTVHVAIGTDIIHFHPTANGAAIGKTSHRDFRMFARLVSELEGGVFINLGSAVIMPEVFLKALTLVRNLGYAVRDVTTVNMDFLRHYRPMTNVVHRPTLEGGKGFSLVGHHEIMLPLLAAAVVEGLANHHQKGKS